ncbi:type II secretion system F family protein [Candidatus Micrarchaeota archaeon]|nr:type II secretion system F family protein [Candidatus Micrarchaeota archaeon]
MAVNFEVIGRLAPREYIKRFGNMLSSAGWDIAPQYLLGALIIASIIISLILTISLYNIPYTNHLLFITTKTIFDVGKTFGISIDLTTISGQTTFVGVMLAIDTIISFILGPLIIFLSIYTIIMLRIDSRRQKVEEVLPDFLLLASANVRAGMPIDQALWYAAKPEFGTLALEVELVARRVFAGQPFDQAIDLLAIRLESRSVHRAVALIKQGIASGGEIANILEKTGEEARKMHMVRKDISTSLLMYIIFIVFAAAVATPFLFSVSHQLLINLEGIVAKLPSTDMSSIGGGNIQSYGGLAGLSTMFHFGQMPITSDQFLFFAIFAIFATSILSSLIIGVIRFGSKVRGVRYIPFMLVVSYAVFVISEGILRELLKVIVV